MKYTPWFALGEFVDNAITSARQNEVLLVNAERAYVLSIDIRFDEVAGTIEIADNAAGIKRDDLPRALRTASPPADQRFLSIYGVGMKAAGLWWAKTLTIETKALGESVRRTMTIDTRDLDDPGHRNVEVTEAAANTFEHGTVIRLSNLTKKVPEGRTLGKIRTYLASMYRHFLMDGSSTIRVKGEDLAFEYPELLCAPYWPSTAGAEVGLEQRLWRRDIAIVLISGRKIEGWIGLLAKGSTTGAGFLLAFHRKAVMGIGAETAEGDEFYRPKQIFGGSNSYRRQRLVGEFDVSEFGKSITSDAVNWEAEQEEEFLDLLREELFRDNENFLEMAENYRIRSQTAPASGTIQMATDGAVDALDKTARTQRPLFSDVTLPIDPPDETDVSARKTRVVHIPFPSGSRSVEVQLSVERAGEADWLSVYREPERLVVRVNEDHPFMLSFAQLPMQQIEPVLRLALGLGVAEYVDPDHVRTRLNALLRGPLATRSGLDVDDVI